jgi:hypothetical protein
MPSSTASMKIGVPAPSSFLHKELDDTASDATFDSTGKPW